MADSTTPDATRDHLAQILLDHVDVARQVDGEPMLTCTCGEFVEEWKPAHSSGFLAHRADAVLAALRDDAIAALNREVARRIGVARELTAAEAERDELRKLTASCSCASGPNFEGPAADCPVHGAVRAFNQASAEIARLTTERDALLPVVQAADALVAWYRKTAGDPDEPTLMSPLRPLADAVDARASARAQVLALQQEVAHLETALAEESERADKARARANEAARLSADARDQVADLHKQIGDLHEQVTIVEADRLDRDRWALNVATFYNLPNEPSVDSYASVARFVKSVVAERDEFQYLFDLQQTRMYAATALWRQEDPDARALVVPDLGALLDWLMRRPVVYDQVQGHIYRSTACLHAHEPGRDHLHRECQTDGKRWDGTEKTPAECKVCAAPCQCGCHTAVSRQDTPLAEAEVVDE